MAAIFVCFSLLDYKILIGWYQSACLELELSIQRRKSSLSLPTVDLDQLVDCHS